MKKIQKKKEKNFFSAKILEKLLDKGKGRWYDSTGKDPLYKDRTILYEKEQLGDTGPSGLPLNTPDIHTESPKEGKFSLLTKKIKTLNPIELFNGMFDSRKSITINNDGFEVPY